MSTRVCLLGPQLLHQQVLEHVKKTNPYALIDPVLSSVQRINITTGARGSLPLAKWRASINVSQLLPGWLHMDAEFNGAEWLVPQTYLPRAGEARLAHPRRQRSGLRTVLLLRWADLTPGQLDGFACPFLRLCFGAVCAIPVNVRNVLSYILWARPTARGSGDAGSIILAADSEGTLVALQAAIALIQPDVGTGYPPPVLHSPANWLKASLPESGHRRCRDTPSMAELLQRDRRHGDPDTGDCTNTPTWERKVADCRYSYLTYFYGLAASCRPRATSRRRAANGSSGKPTCWTPARCCGPTSEVSRRCSRSRARAITFIPTDLRSPSARATPGWTSRRSTSRAPP